MSPADLVVTPMGLRFAGRQFPCTIGRTGTTRTKTEGDGASPVGIHRIVGMLYRPDRLPRPAAWAEPIGPRDLWSDAPDQPTYNHLVRAPYIYSHEKLCRADPMYDLILATDWNYPDAEPNKGSAIFVHQWRRPGAPTAGCVALSRRDLHWIAGRISPGSRLIIP